MRCPTLHACVPAQLSYDVKWPSQTDNNLAPVVVAMSQASQNIVGQLADLAS